MVEKPSDDPIKLIDRPDLARQIRQTLQQVPLTRAGTGAWVGPPFRSLPVSLAFDMVARTDGKTYPIGQMVLGKNSFSVTALQDAPVQTFDLIFRSSESAARKTPDFFEIWKGEIVLENQYVPH